MDSAKEILKNLISIDKISLMTSSEIINEIASNQYNENNRHLKDRKIFSQIPVMIQDILVLADFDTELNMNGILGFLENSSGLYLSETIQALERIGAYEDMKIMKDINSIMMSYKCSVDILRKNNKKGFLFQITNFISTHGEKYEEMADEIEKEGKKLYYRSEDRNIFDLLEKYIEIHKDGIK